MANNKATAVALLWKKSVCLHPNRLVKNDTVADNIVNALQCVSKVLEAGLNKCKPDSRAGTTIYVSSSLVHSLWSKLVTGSGANRGILYI